MRNQDWIALFNGQSGTVMTFWSVYVLVVGLVVGFVVQKERLDGVNWLWVGAFLFFALTNGYPMFRAQRTVQAIHAKLPGEAREMFKIWPPWEVASVHIILDVLVVIFLFRRGKRSPT